MRGATTSKTVLRQSKALYKLVASPQNVTRPAAALSASMGCSSHWSFAPRPFHTTPAYLKKGRGKAREEEKAPSNAKEKRAEKGRSNKDTEATADASSSPAASQHPTPSAEDPLDFADVRSRLAKGSESALDALKKLKAGGRFNPDAIGALRVQPDRKEGATYPLRELAQVVPKGGRTISILVHEEAYVKPVMSAIQASRDFNQQPQRDPDNELELVLKMELEKREDVAKRAKAVCHDWRERVRQIRQKRDKLHATWKKDGLIVPDLQKRANTELDKVIKAKIAEIDAAEKDALKAAEGK
ncbi:hypothetical protein JX265_001518 [Neoarthrinium moseri]|uniref:Ribosome recycling factor domain-containing protein n=1 Tax=Neoarthrinium moseri TaxID=1658444 RepID=A0A9P9WV65_9PEZI|nr:hypothetical protein JX265_001518 [Neoarthrinium moseri]